MHQVQDALIRVPEPVRRSEPLSHAEDAESTSDTSVCHAIYLTGHPIRLAGRRCNRVRARTVNTVGWRGEEEEAQEEKVVGCVGQRVGRNTRSGLHASDRSLVVLAHEHQLSHR